MQPDRREPGAPRGVRADRRRGVRRAGRLGALRRGAGVRRRPAVAQPPVGRLHRGVRWHGGGRQGRHRASDRHRPVQGRRLDRRLLRRGQRAHPLGIRERGQAGPARLLRRGHARSLRRGPDLLAAGRLPPRGAGGRLPRPDDPAGEHGVRRPGGRHDVAHALGAGAASGRVRRLVAPAGAHRRRSHRPREPLPRAHRRRGSGHAHGRGIEPRARLALRGRQRDDRRPREAVRPDQRGHQTRARRRRHHPGVGAAARVPAVSGHPAVRHLRRHAAGARGGRRLLRLFPDR